MRMRGPLILAVVVPMLCPAQAPLHGQEGFLFSAPRAWLTVRGGPMIHSANSDLFDFLTTELTLDRKDFRAPSLGAELGLVAHPQVDVSLGLSWSETSSQSEFRDWVDQDDMPIQQVTKLRTIPLTLSARYYPLSRGEAVSSLAWLPSRVTPYVGGGAGMTWFYLQTRGDFFEEANYVIFYDDYEASNRATTLHALAGTDVWVHAKLGLNIEARYTRGYAPLNRDFDGYDSLDIGGMQAAVGLTLRW